MNIRRSVFAPLLIALVAMVTGGWFLQQGVRRETSVYAQSRLLQEVLDHISERYVEEVDPYRMAIDGLIRELGDPHTAFMTPEDYDALRVQTQGEYGGLGIQIDQRGDWITVIAPLPETPAERAGIMSGDRIVEVNGESARGWTTERAVNELRGPKGEPVHLRVSRVGVDELIPFTIVRDDIHLFAAKNRFITEDGIGYVELTVFSESSAEELEEAIRELQAKGMRGLVLDLRRNPGGLLDQGVATSDLFLDRGALVLETRSRMATQEQKFHAITPDRFPGLPIVVLVGPGSASASEILAGALQDHDRALVVGETSFGKGSVQTLFPLTGGNYLKLTTARWYTPSGRSIQKPIVREEDPDVVALSPVPSPLGDPVVDADAADQPVEEFRTASGRVVYGGGGIYPDLLVTPDTLTTAEQEFAMSLQSDMQQFRNVLFSYAVQYTHDHPNLNPDFEVTTEALDGLYRALREANVEVDRGLYDGARRWVSQQLGYQIAYGKWGEVEARRRVMRDDPQVKVARELLAQASTPAELFAVAARWAPVDGTASASRAQPVINHP